MRLLCYLRTSTSDQARFGTIEAQRQEVPRVAERNGWSIVETLEDEGRSGRRLAGRVLEQVLHRIEQGELSIDGILVADASRLMRPDPDDLESLMDAQTIRFLLRKHHIALVDVTGAITKFDGSTLHADVQAAVASDEWQKIRQRTVAGKKVAARLGRPVSRWFPFGRKWIVDPDKKRAGRWEVDPEAARVVEKILRHYVDDRMGGPLIASTLNAEGIPSPRGGRWHGSAVLRLIGESSLVGDWQQEVGGEVILCNIPPLVARELWERAQAIKGRRGNTFSKRRQVTTLLSGLARSGHCGYAVVAGSARLSDGTLKPRYNCSCAARQYSHDEDPCPLRSCYAEPIDEMVWAQVQGLLGDPAALMRAAQLTADAVSVGGLESEVRHLDGLLRKLNSAVSEAMRLWRRGSLTESQRDTTISETNAERVAVERNLELAKKRLASGRQAESVSRSLTATAERLSKLAVRATGDQRREIVRALCPTSDFGFVLTREGGEVVVRGRLCLEVADGARVSVEVA